VGGEDAEEPQRLNAQIASAKFARYENRFWLNPVRALIGRLETLLEAVEYDDGDLPALHTRVRGSPDSPARATAVFEVGALSAARKFEAGASAQRQIVEKLICTRALRVRV
jgi:hypothetical protein